MNENFITIFNYDYLPQGLTMYYSLKKNLPKSTLWIVCMDKKLEIDLQNRNLPDLKIISHNKIENLSLRRVKKKRKLHEYCWTLTPFIPSYIFKNFKNIKSITYLDADIFFYKSPQPIINEFINSKKSILITEHGFHPKFDLSHIVGKFCVQYMIFKNNLKCKMILNWWQKKCIEWCHDFPEDGKLGDQKYLDEWPKIFKKYIHIAKNKKYFQGPWTFNRFKTKDMIIYHFHGLKINVDKVYIYNSYGLTKTILKEVYFVYFKFLKEVLNKVDNKFTQINKNNKKIFELKVFINKYLLKKKNKVFIFNLKNK